MDCFWSGFEKDPFPFCEEQLCHIIGQPANTWTNIGFFIAAYYLWKNIELNHRRYYFAAISFYLGIGSTLFHMSATAWAKKLDVSAMLLLTGLSLLISLQKRFQFSTKKLIAAFVLLSSSTIPLIGWGRIGGKIFLAQLLATIVHEFLYLKTHSLSLKQKKILKQIAVVFPLALAISLLDQTGYLCEPTNHILTGHGVWHLATAYCLYLAGEYFSLKE